MPSGATSLGIAVGGFGLHAQRQHAAWDYTSRGRYGFGLHRCKLRSETVFKTFDRPRKTAKSPAPGGVQERVFARTLSLKLQEPEYSNHIDTVERYIRKCEVQTYAHSAHQGNAKFSERVRDGPCTSPYTAQ